MSTIPEPLKEIYDLYKSTPVDDISKLIKAANELRECRKEIFCYQSFKDSKEQLEATIGRVSALWDRFLKIEATVKIMEKALNNLCDPFKEPELGD